MSKSIFVGVTIGILAAAMIISSIITVSYASIESNTSANSEESGPVIPSGSSTHFPVPPDSIKASLEHINNAQEALQNGDTGAKLSFKRIHSAYSLICIKMH